MYANKYASYKFIYNKTINGKRKEINLEVSTISEAVQKLQSMELKVSSSSLGNVTIYEGWQIFCESLKYKQYSENTQKNKIHLFKKHFSLSEKDTSQNINMLVIDFYASKNFLVKVLSKSKNKSHNLIKNLVNLLKDLVIATEVKFNIVLQIDFKLLLHTLQKGLPKVTTKHHSALLSESGSLEQLRSNVSEIIRAIQNCKISCFYKQILFLTFYTGLRINEVLNIKMEDIVDNERYIHIPMSNSIYKIIETIKSIRNKYSIYLFNNKNGDRLEANKIRKSLVSFNKYINYENIRSYEDHQSIHGIRTLMREFMYLKEDQISYETAEACLSHKLGSQNDNAYNRNHLALTANRIYAMKLWSDFLDECFVLIKE